MKKVEVYEIIIKINYKNPKGQKKVYLYEIPNKFEVIKNNTNLYEIFTHLRKRFRKRARKLGLWN